MSIDLVQFVDEEGNSSIITIDKIQSTQEYENTYKGNLFCPIPGCNASLCVVEKQKMVI